MIWTILGGIVIVFVFLALYYKNKMIMSGNPINTIDYDRCLGFKIGDRRDLVMSRIKHLDLLSAKEKEDIEKHIKSGYGNDRISTSSGKFNNVGSMSFIFNNKNILNSIFISIEPTQCDKESMIEILGVSIEKSVGVPFHKSNGNTVWKRGNSIIDFESKSSMYISISNQTL